MVLVSLYEEIFWFRLTKLTDFIGLLSTSSQPKKRLFITIVTIRRAKIFPLKFSLSLKRKKPYSKLIFIVINGRFNMLAIFQNKLINTGNFSKIFVTIITHKRPILKRGQEDLNLQRLSFMTINYSIFSCGLHTLLSAEALALRKKTNFEIKNLNLIRKNLLILLLQKCLNNTSN